MRLLIDTHLLLWTAAMPRRISTRALSLMTDPANVLIFSVASIWEIAIKTARGKPDFDVDTRELRERLLNVGYEELPVSGEHAIGVGSVNTVHNDPFDRLLIAQAISENASLVTSDGLIARYPGPILKV
jgi:PIN domain nuclease of toxin-antitoxin system